MTIDGYGLSDNDYRILISAYGFTVGDDGFLYGLLNGDLGYEKTGLKVTYERDDFAQPPPPDNSCQIDVTQKGE